METIERHDSSSSQSGPVGWMLFLSALLAMVLEPASPASTEGLSLVPGDPSVGTGDAGSETNYSSG